MFRYMAFLWNGTEQRAAVQTLVGRLQATDARWTEIVHGDGIRAFTIGVRNSSAAHILSNGLGVVLGTLFEREAQSHGVSRTAPQVLDPAETTAILTSKGHRLIERYWGRYVALLADPAVDRKWIVKDPCGQLPCFITETQGIQIVFSYLQDCFALGLEDFSINWDFVRACVALGELQAEGTALKEVEPVWGGERLELTNNRISRSLVWHPLGIVQSEPIRDAQTAVRELRTAVSACVHTWTSRYRNIVHRTSGGLDSSVVLAFLRSSEDKPRVTCVTYYVPGNSRDERPWARLAVAPSGFEHVEQPRTTRVNWSKLLQTTLSPYPMPIFPQFETGLLERPITRALEADGIFTGDGGDAVFGRYSASFATAQYLRDHGVNTGLPRVAADQALVTNRSFSQVLWSAFRARLFDDGWNQLHSWAQIRKLPAQEVLEATRGQSRRFCHPWFRNADSLPFATLLRLGPLLQSSGFYDPLALADDAAPEPVVPLASQPVIETSLRIPVHWHIAGGQSRALARQAFASDIPGEILARDWKDRAPGFFEGLLISGRAFIRELLLDGILVREKLLNRSPLEEILADRISRTSISCGELFDYVQIEAWLRNWTDKRYRAAA